MKQQNVDSLFLPPPQQQQETSSDSDSEPEEEVVKIKKKKKKKKKSKKKESSSESSSASDSDSGSEEKVGGFLRPGWNVQLFVLGDKMNYTVSYKLVLKVPIASLGKMAQSSKAGTCGEP